ncbi:MAG TPA: hypothetical protein VHZ55_00460 [Bryobacteraceae bacterium]|nr:hypothetical protein [Bryobacteraceae bacterium]
MDAWFDLISAQKGLPSYLEEDLLKDGFIVAPVDFASDKQGYPTVGSFT